MDKVGNYLLQKHNLMEINQCFPSTCSLLYCEKCQKFVHRKVNYLYDFFLVTLTKLSGITSHRY